MALLKLQPDPTFKAPVKIPVAGSEPVSVEFTFKHRTRAGLEAFVAASGDRDDASTILECATAWELADPFDRASIELLAANYIGAPRAIFETYVDELTKGRVKN